MYVINLNDTLQFIYYCGIKIVSGWSLFMEFVGYLYPHIVVFTDI